jgi:hypothetical protein
MLSDTIYPAPSSAELRKHFLGKHISDLPSPSVILDEAVLKRNCERMLQAPKTFGIDFRAHVKTHKVSCQQLRTLLFSHFPQNKMVWLSRDWEDHPWSVTWDGVAWVTHI